jgi:tetratricopeptide (TPR) repeat protein
VYQKAISILRHLPDRGQAQAIVWRNLSTALTAEGRYREALAALHEASKLVSGNTLKDLQLRGTIWNSYGVVYFYLGKFDKAEASFRRASESPYQPQGQLDLDIGDVLNNLGRVYQVKKEYAKAESAYLRSLQLTAARFGTSHRHLSIPLDNLAALYRDMGRYTESETHFQRSLEIQEHSELPLNETSLMHTLWELGKTYIRENDNVRAETVLARASELARKCVLSQQMPHVFRILETYADILNARSNPIEAERLHAEAQRVRASMAFTVHVENLK